MSQSNRLVILRKELDILCKLTYPPPSGQIKQNKYKTGTPAEAFLSCILYLVYPAQSFFFGG
jgi:hypothetical protein